MTASELTPMALRTVIIGPPKAGKTTLAGAIANVQPDTQVLHTDDLIGLGWSEASQHIANHWLSRPGPLVIEGVAAVRGLRKWCAANAAGKPCDVVLYLTEPWVKLSPGQASMATGHTKIWAEIEAELVSRGVEVRRLRQGEASCLLRLP